MLTNSSRLPLKSLSPAGTCLVSESNGSKKTMQAIKSPVHIIIKQVMSYLRTNIIKEQIIKFLNLLKLQSSQTKLNKLN
jgi:hypothetical protein